VIKWGLLSTAYTCGVVACSSGDDDGPIDLNSLPPATDLSDEDRKNILIAIISEFGQQTTNVYLDESFGKSAAEYADGCDHLSIVSDATPAQKPARRLTIGPILAMESRYLCHCYSYDPNLRNIGAHNWWHTVFIDRVGDRFKSSMMSGT
jgi:hypothetical protein